jgi:hypothetical protein
MEQIMRVWSSVTVALLLIGMLLWLRSPAGEYTNTALGMGLFLLMVTPVLKLLSVMIDEVRARDWRFAALGVAVLALLAGSIALAAR